MSAKMRRGVLVSVAVVVLLVMLPLTALATNHVTAYSGTASCESFELHAEITGVVTLYWRAELYRWDGATWVPEDFHSNGPLGEEVSGPTFDYQGLWRSDLPDGEYLAVLRMGVTPDVTNWSSTIPGITLPCSPPTAVALASFDADAAGAAIVLDWETAAELDTLGFNVYRAESAAGCASYSTAA